ncbi:hypothetical protein ACIQRK_19580 [Streptomyces anulatus]
MRWTWLTPELLLAEVRGTLDELNGRPDSTGRCLAAADAFPADRSGANRSTCRTPVRGSAPRAPARSDCATRLLELVLSELS